MKSLPKLNQSHIQDSKAVFALMFLTLFVLIGVSFAAALLASTVLGTKSTSFFVLIGACFISAGLTVATFFCVSMLLDNKHH